MKGQTKSFAPGTSGRYLCPHCGIDMTIPAAGGGSAPDSGGDCLTCERALCRRCAGGWCDGGDA